MMRFLRKLGVILLVIASALVFSLLVQRVVPFRLRVGMPWAEAERTLSWVVHFRVRSSIRQAWPINGETGEIEYYTRLHPIELPDATCIFIKLRAPYDAARGRAGFDDADYSIASFEVGPRFRGYPDKLVWFDLPKKHPAVVDVSWCSWPAISAFIVGLVVAAILMPRLLRRLSRRLSEKFRACSRH